MQQVRLGDQILNEIFNQVGANSISDIQLRSNRLPYIHTKKGLEIVHTMGPLPGDAVLEVVDTLYTRQESEAIESATARLQGQMGALERLQEFKVVDFASEGVTFADGSSSGRMRVQAHLSSSGLGVTCRLLSDSIPELDPLGLSADTVRALKGFIVKRQGLGLVTGQTGSGKSTTLAAVLNWLRCNQPRHIVTVEDPIEYRYPHDMVDHTTGKRIPSPGFMTQQEVGKHVENYHQGLKDALRKAPHVILIGEIRDKHTMETAIEAAQTGHIVISTLHTNGAVKTMSRILEFFPRDAHRSILGRVSDILLFVLSQGLITGLNGRVLNYEFLQNNSSAVRSGIAAYDSGTKALEDVIRHAGNVQWDSNLRNLVRRGLISEEAFQMNRMADGEDESNLFVKAAV